MERQRIRFASGDTQCTAWHYPGVNGGCVIMTGGFAVTKEPGTDLFAGRFNEAGFGVLAFDYRNIGESGGQPRQVQRVGEQLADWQAAIGHARTLPGVDPARLAPQGELARLPGGHYEPFLGGHERAVEAELSFLRRHLLGESPAGGPGASVTSAGRRA